jgi:hypothetical protein
MAIDHAALRALIDAEPLNAARTDAQVRDDWWLLDVTVPRDIDYQTLMIWASEEQVSKKLWEAIETYKADLALGTPTATYTASVINDTLTLSKMIDSGGEIALSRSEIRTIVSTISGPGADKPLSTPNKNALNQKADVTLPRWQAEGYPQMDEASWLHHIGVARAL